MSTPALPRSSMDAGAIREAIVKTFTPELLGAGTETSTNTCETWIQILADLIDEPVALVRCDLIGDASRRASSRVQVAPLYRALALQMHLRDDADMANDAPAVDAAEQEAERLVLHHLTECIAGLFSGHSGVRNLRLVFEQSDEKELHFDFDFFHSDGAQTSHALFVRPSMHEPFDLRVGGRNRGDLKKALRTAFGEALRKEVEYR
jgi:hypothetical protein